MTTSSSWDFSLTATQLIQAAYEDLGVVLPGGSISTARSTLALSRLNMIAKQHQGHSDGSPGLKVHTRQRIALTLAKGQQTYTIGPAATDSNASTLLGRTTVATAYSSGTSLVVAAITDTTTYPGTTISMTSADIFGVQLNDGTIGWTTLNGTPGSTTVTLTAGFSSGAAIGNYVYWYTSRAQRFPYIESATLRQSSYTEIPLRVYTQAEEYDQGVTNKYASGDPVAVLVEPLRLNTRVTLNAQPSDVTKQIILTVFYPAEDYDSASNDLAFPQEAFLWLNYELQRALAFPMRVQWTPDRESARVQAMANYFNLNPENSVLSFQTGGL